MRVFPSLGYYYVNNSRLMGYIIIVYPLLFMENNAQSQLFGRVLDTKMIKVKFCKFVN
jgi:hypothetical protein